MQNITILATSNAMKEPDILWGFNKGKIRNLVGDDDDHDCDDDDDDVMIRNQEIMMVLFQLKVTVCADMPV